jgi:hypothetical protein
VGIIWVIIERDVVIRSGVYPLWRAFRKSFRGHSLRNLRAFAWNECRKLTHPARHSTFAPAKNSCGTAPENRDNGGAPKSAGSLKTDCRPEQAVRSSGNANVHNAGTALPLVPAYGLRYRCVLMDFLSGKVVSGRFCPEQIRKGQNRKPCEIMS